MDELLEKFLPLRDRISELTASGRRWVLVYETSDQIDLEVIQGADGTAFEPRAYGNILNKMQSYGVVQGEVRSGAALHGKTHSLVLTDLGQQLQQELDSQ